MCISPVFVKGQYVSCGKCIECLMLKSSEWAYRISLEALSCDSNAIITLTYDDEHLPEDKSLRKRDLQLFLKRLRKKLPVKIRFFACGEYGKKFDRPHYHVIIFGYNFPDKYKYCFDNKGTQLFRSDLLESCWKLGFSTVGELTFDSAKYCAKYLQKIPEDGKQRSFLLMSRRPGIGLSGLNPKWLLSDKMYVNGKFQRLPRYFIDKLESQGYGLWVSVLKAKRQQSFNQFKDKNGILNTGKYLEFVYNRQERFKKYFNTTFSDVEVVKGDTFFDGLEKITSFYEKSIDK